mmetsp:Transcript_19881/g.59466  ORF Transcript_19881/g.59466 Transcript_19881/m.59466 type:complete len:334 (+) Transcript_19881:450-1451(+)
MCSWPMYPTRACLWRTSETAAAASALYSATSRSARPPSPSSASIKLCATLSLEERISETNCLMALCSKLLQGWRKKSSKQRGSSCSLRSASRMAAQPVLTSMVIRSMSSRVALPTATTWPMGIVTASARLKDASIRLRIRGKCDPMSRISKDVRPDSQVFGLSGLNAATGDRGGDDGARVAAASPTTESSAPTLTTSSSPTRQGAGDSGESVGVEGHALAFATPADVWKTMLDKMEVAADAAPGEPEKMQSMSMPIAASDVSCLRKSSPKQMESFCASSSTRIKATHSSVSGITSGARIRPSRRRTKSSVGKASCADCSAHNKRTKSSASDLK